MFLRDYCEKNLSNLKNNTGRGSCGLQAILRPLAEAHLCRLLPSILKNKKHQTKKRALHPLPEGRGLAAKIDKIKNLMDITSIRQLSKIEAAYDELEELADNLY